MSISKPVQLKFEFEEKPRPISATLLFNMIVNDGIKISTFYDWIRKRDLRLYNKGYSEGYDNGHTIGYNAGKNAPNYRSNY